MVATRRPTSVSGGFLLPNDYIVIRASNSSEPGWRPPLEANLGIGAREPAKIGVSRCTRSESLVVHPQSPLPVRSTGRRAGA